MPRYDVVLTLYKVEVNEDTGEKGWTDIIVEEVISTHKTLTEARGKFDVVSTLTEDEKEV